VVLTPVVTPPELPADVLPAGIDWHPETRRWWKAWQDSALTDQLSEVEWHELVVSARLHHAIHAEGDLRLAAELRRRVGAFGATAEDRARLHLTTAEADAKEARAHAGQAVSARQRYGNVRSLPTAADPAAGLAEDEEGPA